MRLPGSEKVIVGYDLGNKYAQISCYVTGSEEEIRTLSSVAGSSVYTIPLALSKRQGVNQWFYGSEAIRYAGEEEGILVENLLKLARDGEPVQIDGAPIDPVALLTLFLKRSLGLLSQVTNTERIGALMITCEELDHRMLEVLTAATEGLHLKTDQICFQSHVESFYYYNLYQPEELWRHKSDIMRIWRCFHTYLLHGMQPAYHTCSGIYGGEGISFPGTGIR